MTDPHPHIGPGDFQNLVGRVGSGREMYGFSQVGSGRVGSGRVGSGRVGPDRLLIIISPTNMMHVLQTVGEIVFPSSYHQQT